MKKNKTTIDDILTYETNEDDKYEDVIIKQILCLKEASYLFDSVLNNHKNSIEKITNIIEKIKKENYYNFEVIKNALNEILDRLKLLEIKVNEKFLN